MDKEKLRRVALGIDKAAIVLKNCKIVNVFSGLIETGDIAIEEGIIAGIGKYEGITETDMCFSYVSPGLIDGHVHIESSMLSPGQFAKVIVPLGTTTVIADPHEIANVCGLSGIRFMLESSANVPLDVRIMIPSCVPTTVFETAGASINADEIGALKNEKSIVGLGEMMNYPGVIGGDRETYRKLYVMADKMIDGHAPGVTGEELNAYVLAGVKTDHEATTAMELREKVSRGMYVHLREGSVAKNEETLLKAVNKDNLSRLMFCTDDKHPEDIRKEGHINHNVTMAIENGLDMVDAIKMATINTATCYNLKNTGGIAPGYYADLIVFDDPGKIVPRLVYKKGQLVARDGKALFSVIPTDDPAVEKTVRFDPERLNFSIPLHKNRVHVIGFDKDNLTTRKLTENVRVENGYYRQEKNSGILKLAIVERHRMTGNIGLALVRGYGLKGGALAMTIAHDSHNMVVIGDDDEAMRKAALKLREIQGGIALVYGNEIFDYLQLETGGLMTQKDYHYVEQKLERMSKQARKMGVDPNIDDPFLALAFLSLPVIPELKVTDKGLFDVNKFKIIPLEVMED
ncbi:MAG TPA: adenine deaminase [Bacillota bacterium]|nr:adenine deaminase [Bacillota bacterium]HPF42533.1 adenine deaminase [Bacillota bacterium]HPJ86023.1 adenine deaminase [Bacillota bacterium]HPQ62034.1 adenine deaminase [Bacillota bacterium]HRX91823.1 adenine deaminase [Candidatus Izemoplasmatales bacterium]